MRPSAVYRLTRLTAAMQSTPFATNDSVFGFPSLIAMLKRLPCYARDSLATAAWSRPDQANVSGFMDSALPLISLLRLQTIKSGRSTRLHGPEIQKHKSLL